MSQNPSRRRSFWDLFLNEESDPAAPASVAQTLSHAPASADPRAFDEESVFWAMRRLPVTEATKHFLICGAIGSGKTTAIELFLRSIAPRFRARRRRPEQLVVFDAKCDVVPTLAALGLKPGHPNVWILNPIDERTAVWNLAEAVQTPVMARHLATLLVPEEPRASTPYFNDAARELVYAVLLAFNATIGTDWTLRDLLCALESSARIKAVTGQQPRAKALAGRILHDDLHGKGVLSTLGTKLGKFEQVAALWHTAKNPDRKFSITEFLQQPGVLILGNDPVLRESIWPINAILLRALTQEILRRPNTLRPRHWFVLDEFRAMEKVDSIHDLLNRGRSKGASVLLGIQSVEGLEDIYQVQRANDILTQCAYKTFLRAGGPKTAEWAEKFFGQVRRTEAAMSEQWGAGGKSTSVRYEVRERPLFIGSYFLDLPFPTAGEDYVAVHDVPCLKRISITRRPFDQLLAWNRKPQSRRPVPSVELRENPADQHLQPWTPEEEQRFCGGVSPRKRQRRRTAKSPPETPKDPPKTSGEPGPSRDRFYGDAGLN